jgi:hypothetical protein
VSCLATDHRHRRFTKGFHGRGPRRALHQDMARQSGCELRVMEPGVCGMLRYPDPSRSRGRGSPATSARSICAMSTALDRGLKQGVGGYLSAPTTYNPFSFSKSATDLALVTFAVENACVACPVGALLIHVIPSAFIAAVIGSAKKIGSTRSITSPATSRKLRLFSSGMRARRAPLSMPTWSGSDRDFTDLILP